ncbi:MAG: alpha/beta hydrolase [Clostridiales bacterium]
MIHNEIDIWKGFKYEGEMADDFRPTMTTYMLSGEKKRGTVLVLPGGGYSHTSPREAEPIAIKFNEAGYHAVVLYYSVAPRRYPQQVLDCARALTIILEKANEWKIDTKKIYVNGFSAGGHLAASISNLYKESWIREQQGVKIGKLVLKGSILAYPVITGLEFRHEGSFINLLGEDATADEREQLSMEGLVNAQTPPTFIWHTFEDMAVPLENTLLYAMALRKMTIPFELHIYPKGGHGLSLATAETAIEACHINKQAATWIDLCIGWMID